MMEMDRIYKIYMIRRKRINILLANSAKSFGAPEGRRKLAGGGARALLSLYP